MSDERPFTPIEVWVGLHVEIENWHLKCEGVLGSLHPLDDKANAIYLEYLQDFPAKKWAMIGDAAGWTPVAAMALSWCNGATWESILKAWQAVEKLDPGSPVASLAAQMTNPDFLPEPELKAVLKLGETPGGAWVLLSALKLHNKVVQFDDRFVKRSAVHSVLWPLLKE